MSRVDKELWTPFIKLWEEAHAAGMSPEELSEISGIHIGTIRSRQIALRDRGVMLPLLRGQSGPNGPRGKRRKPTAEVVAGPKPSVESIVIYVM